MTYQAKLSRSQKSIEIPNDVPATLPDALAENITKLTVGDLKKICDLWKIPRAGAKTLIDLRKNILGHFEDQGGDASDSDSDTDEVRHVAESGESDSNTDMPNLFDDLLKIKIEKTQGGKTQHNSKVQSNLIIDILKRHEFMYLDQKKEKKAIASDTYSHLSPGKYYIEQPFGSQLSPDFILLHVLDDRRHKTIRLECKVGSDAIMWNDGCPQSNDVYLFTCTKRQITLILCGSDMMSETDKELYDELGRIKDKLNKEFRDKFKLANSEFYPTLRGGWKQNKISQLPANTAETRLVFESFLLCDASRPRGISLFAGAGGDTQGMEMCGVDVIGFVEIDPIATKTHLLNFPNSVLIGSNITLIKDEKFAEYEGQIDYLFGGFPCQTFSHGGKKDINDPRGQLYVDFVRATRLIRPKWVIGENVKGILSRKNGDGICMADVVVKAFEAIGYSMKYRLINASQFGVPQARERVIFIGWPSALSILADGTPAAVAFAIPESNGRTSCLRDVLEFSLDDAMEMPQRIIEKIPVGKFIIGGSDESNPTGAPPTNLVKCAENKTELDDITYRTRGKSTFSCIVDIDDVSRTLICTYMHMPRLFVPVDIGARKYMRPYTVLECQRIQGFPDTFRFAGKKTEKIKQIGNAVPPVIIASMIEYLKQIAFAGTLAAE